MPSDIQKWMLHALASRRNGMPPDDSKKGMLKIQYEKSLLRPKDVYSAMLNCNSDRAFPMAIGGTHFHLNFAEAERERKRIAPTTIALNTAINTLRAQKVINTTNRHNSTSFTTIAVLEVLEVDILWPRWVQSL